MKYFTKYLPVEGEIKKKVGQWMIHPREHPEAIEVDNMPKSTAAVAYERNGWKPAKLFLCSRDIQVGDKLRIRQYNGDPDWEAELVEKDDTFYRCKYIDVHNNSFFSVLVKDAVKIIGEISPDATWVKEGDEFDSTEIAWFYDTGDLDYTVLSELLPEEPFPTGTFMVKCPTCSHFH